VDAKEYKNKRIVQRRMKYNGTCLHLWIRVLWPRDAIPDRVDSFLMVHVEEDS
jgi:hypothetical protein